MGPAYSDTKSDIGITREEKYRAISLTNFEAKTYKVIAAN